MKVWKRAIVLVLWTCALSGTASSQTDSAQIVRPLTFQALYTGDVISNLRGGITTGSCFLGMADILVRFDTKAAGLWSNGLVFMKAANTHGAVPSDALFGDYQVMSNLQAGDHSYLQEFWYSHTMGPVAVTIGLQDLNVLFMVNEYGGIYLNSSFGVHPTLSTNLTPPIFPLTSTGVTVSWKISDRFALLASAYDGHSLNFTDNPYNIKWRYTADDGILAVVEAQMTIGDDNCHHGAYKIGAYNHDHLAEFNPASNSTEIVYRNNYGMYFTIDQTIAGTAGAAGCTAVFARGSMATREYNDNYLFVGGGMNYYGLFTADGSDVLGLAFAHVCMQRTEHETALELTYQAPVTENLSLQPDLQYILHPVGTGVSLPNALGASLRFGIHF
jgi:porin